MTPGLEQCRGYREAGYTMLPVMRRLVADDLTPVAAMSRLIDEEFGFLFESVVGGERMARYSMLGVAPRERLVGGLDCVEVIRVDGSRERLPGDPYAAVRAYMARYTVPDLAELPRFSGGLVGYFSYDTVRLLEHLPAVPPDPLGLPDINLMRCDTVLVFDHSYNHLLLITHLDLSDPQTDLVAAYGRAEAELDMLQQRLQSPAAPRLVAAAKVAALEHSCHTEREDYMEAVERIREYIRAGDIFQAVPSQRLSAEISVSPFQVYRSVRSLNPSPYMFCLKLGETSLVGASPEIMVRVEAGQVVVRPIAGTIRRGATQEEDAQLARQLLEDPKERAEHVMLIDLGRNDVGRVCEPGSVRLLEEMVIERYSHVQHIVSHIEGRLREGLDALDALRHCHPAGTVSGAPKIRAMEIIDELEPVKRGPYAGAVGYLDFRGNLDTCIALRTAILTPGEAHVQAGAGIVADSDPAREWQETMMKGEAMLQAIARAPCF
ncbi:MAG: anthranilate synthase component I [Planctomycetota bacterium]